MNTYEYMTETWINGPVSFAQWLNERGKQGWHLSTMCEDTRTQRRAWYCVFAGFASMSSGGAPFRGSLANSEAASLTAASVDDA